jgi:excisionase family DNA binding protein
MVSGKSDGRGIRRSPGTGWVTTQTAAELLGVSKSTLDRLRRARRLEAAHHDRSWWIRKDSLEPVAQERSRWISHATAAKLLGAAPTTVTAAVARGELHTRGVAHALPSLDRDEVEAWLEARRQRKAAREARRLEREAMSTAAPDDGRVWLDAETVAIMLGLSARRIRQLATEERLPCTRRGRRVWFLREHIEEICAARAFETHREHYQQDS